MIKNNAKHFLVIGIVGLTILLITYLVSSRPTPPVKPKQETVWTVDTERLSRVDRSPELDLIGEVESTQQALITSRSNTTVTATPFLAGRDFRQGDILVRLDDVEVGASLIQRQADVQELKAAIAEARARHQANLETLETEETLLSLTRKAYERQQRLMKNQVTSEERSDTALSALHQQELAVTNRRLSVNNFINSLAQLEARLKRAEAQLTLAQLDMAQTALKAPFDGRVVTMRVATGERVRPGDPLIELVASDSLEVRAQIPDKWVPQIRNMVNQNSQVSAYAIIYGEQVELKLSRIAAAANPATGGIDIYLSPVSNTQLPLGKPIDLHVKLPYQEDAFTVPLSAIYGDNRIFVVNAESRLQATTIQRLGRYRDESGKERVIFTGPELKNGQAVVITQLPKAVTGLKIRSRQEAAKPTTSSINEPQG
ncbi:efflux RND transporter periplasmic adaptor subunit [Hahella ganghwensis]|uniref:efflux RND transporter periplasmic adaptor subunit n=1 Tax=Hahella ganghwensis TaxID=286420 RepID=UPI00036829CF|nr:efflux RND transporter periplasmic adaptor subunit [Hahella ganghwensis]